MKNLIPLLTLLVLLSPLPEASAEKYSYEWSSWYFFGGQCVRKTETGQVNYEDVDKDTCERLQAFAEKVAIRRAKVLRRKTYLNFVKNMFRINLNFSGKLEETQVFLYYDIHTWRILTKLRTTITREYALPGDIVLLEGTDQKLGQVDIKKGKYNRLGIDNNLPTEADLKVWGLSNMELLDRHVACARRIYKMQKREQRIQHIRSVISETEGNVLTLNLLAKGQRKLNPFERDRLESLFKQVAAKGLVKRKDKDNFLKKVSSFVNYKGKDQDQVKENMRETLDQVNNAFDKYNRIVQKHLRLANKRSKAWQKLGKNSVILTKKRTDHWIRVIKNALKSNPQARIFVIGGRKHFSERFHQQMDDFKVASFNPSFDHKVLSCEVEKWEKMFK